MTAASRTTTPTNMWAMTTVTLTSTVMRAPGTIMGIKHTVTATAMVMIMATPDTIICTV